MFAALALVSAFVTGHAQDPVSVRLSGDGQYTRGESVRVEVKADQDGHLLVLQASPTGVVRVLFPIDPGDDAFVKGGKTYQLRDRSNRTEVFNIDERSGNGLVLVALSKTPLATEAYTENGHWDYRKLTISDKDDLETGLSRMATIIAGSAVKYSVAPYDVMDPNYARGGNNGAYFAGYPYRSWAGYYGWGYSPFYWDPWYGSFYGPYGYGYGYPYYGIGFGFGFGYPFGFYGGFCCGYYGGGVGVPARVGQPYGGRFGNRTFGNTRVTGAQSVSSYRGTSARPGVSGYRSVSPSFSGRVSGGGRSWGGGGGHGGGHH